jgi:hypothetical protein
MKISDGKMNKVLVMTALVWPLFSCGDLSSLAELIDKNETDPQTSQEDDDFTDSLGATDSEDSHMIELGLSEDARAVLERVKLFLDGLREERDALCGIDGSSHDAFREKIDAVLDNDELTDAEKQEQIEALHDEKNHEAEEGALQQCQDENGDALAAIREKAKPVIEACLAQRVEDGHVKPRRHNDGKKRHQQGRIRLSEHEDEGAAGGDDKSEAYHDEDLAELEAALLSAECADALDQAEALEQE